MIKKCLKIKVLTLFENFIVIFLFI